MIFKYKSLYRYFNEEGEGHFKPEPKPKEGIKNLPEKPETEKGYVTKSGKIVKSYVEEKHTSPDDLLKSYHDPHDETVFTPNTKLPDGLFAEKHDPNITKTTINEPEMDAEKQGKKISSGGIIFVPGTGKV